MKMEWIRCFLCVVVTESFAEAADHLYTTQATVSKSIMALEKELGVALFDRTSRRAQLSAAGKQLLPYAKSLMDQYNAFRQEANECLAIGRHQLHIAAIPTMAHYGIASMIAEFQLRYPQIAVHVDEFEACDILHQLDNNEYDMAFMRSDALDRQKYTSLDLFSDRLVLVVPQQHPFAGRAQVSLDELKDEPFLLLDAHTELYAFCLKACRQHNFTPQVSYTGTRIENILEMVSRGAGVSLVMERVASYAGRNGTSIVPLAEPITSNVALVSKRSRPYTDASDLFFALVQREMKPAPQNGHGDDARNGR